MAATHTQATISELMEAMLFLRPIPRLYNEGQLPLEASLETAVRRGSWCEMVASLGVSGVECLVSESVRGLLRFSPCELLSEVYS
jgi:hypothetical protein